MVFTLHRYILKDLFRTFVLTAAVLSVMLGLGVMFRPLRRFGVSPESIPELLLYTLPLTLTMVLPVAALLSTTLNYGRLENDNEIAACRSSGISLGTLVYPALILALSTALASLLLGFNVIPNFARQFDYLIKRDAESLVYRNIRRTGNLNSLGRDFRSFKVRAEEVDPEAHALYDVVVVDQENGQTYTVREARVNIEIGQETNQIYLELIRPIISIRNEGGSDLLTTDSVVLSYDFPSFFEDEIKFKSLSELQDIRENPTLFNPIRKPLRMVREQLLVEMICQRLQRQLEGGGRLTLNQGDRRLLVSVPSSRVQSTPVQRGRRTVHRVDGVRLNGLVDRPIQVFESARDGGPVSKRYVAQRGRLVVNAHTQMPTLSLVLQGVKVHYPDSRIEPPSLLEESLAHLAAPTDLVEQAQLWPLERLMADELPITAAASEYLELVLGHLKQRCAKLDVAITVELHLRLAFGVSCIVLVMLGAALGILLKSGHVLAAFGISFIPATLCLMLIFTGQHIAEQSPDNLGVGLAYLWSGIVTVGLIDWAVYWKLFRM